MATASVSGLVSGLDTATIISQLMQVEAQPQTLLKSKVSSEQTSLSSLQSLNSKLQTIASKAGDLAKLSAWAPFTATSSSDKVTARTNAGAIPGALSFTVKTTASAYKLTYNTLASSADTVVATPGSSLTVTLPSGGSKDIPVGDGTLKSVVAAINNAGAGVRATAVHTDAGYRLRVETTATGQSSSFTITGIDQLGTPVATNGVDASIEIDGETLSSSTNTFTDVITGIDLTLDPTVSTAAPDNLVTITVGRDTKAMTDAVQGMVDAANSVLSDLSTLTSYNTTTKKAGALAGDPTLRALRQELLSGVANGVDNKSLADVGIQLDRYGKVTFDAEKFTAAYTADPTGTARRFAGTGEWTGTTGQVTLVGATWRTAPNDHTVDTTATPAIDGFPATMSNGVLTGQAGTRAEGLAVTVTGSANGTLVYHQGFAAKGGAIAERASDSTAGTVTAAINGRNSTIDSLNDAIDGWDTRLAKRRESLERQYAALEVALGKLQDQSSWLSSQIAGLPSASSS